MAIRVLAAVVEREGRLLVCERPAHKRHGGLWEFPGGKVEPGESDAEAAGRELAEELGVEAVEVGAAEFSVQDPGSPFHIEFLPVRIAGEPTCLEHARLAWVPLEELPAYALAPGDRRYVERRLALSELRAGLAAVEERVELLEEAGFVPRTDALDALDLSVLDRIDALLESGPATGDLLGLRRRAEAVKRELEDADRRLFRSIRAGILDGRHAGAALGALLDSYVPQGSGGRRRLDEPGYDHLDVLVNGVLGIDSLPDEVKPRLPEMVSYQQTPARVILEMIRRARLGADDVLYDLGSGLGHVPALAGLLSPARARGVEFEPAFCRTAREIATGLRLDRVEFVNADAREAECSEGTVFFLYTPFVGEMLREVSDRLRELARRRPIRLLTYGPCTALLCGYGWRVRPGEPTPTDFTLTELVSDG